MVMRFADSERAAFYRIVLEKRGKDAANALIARVNAMRRATSEMV